MKVVFLFLAFSLPVLAVENETVNLQEAFANRIQAHEEAERIRKEREAAVIREADARNTAMWRADMHRLQVYESQTHWIQPKIVEGLNLVLEKIFKSQILAATFSVSQSASYYSQIYFTLTAGVDAGGGIGQEFPEGSICELWYYFNRNRTLTENHRALENGVHIELSDGIEADGIRGMDAVLSISSREARCVTTDGTVFSLPQLQSIDVRIRRGMPVRSSDLFFRAR